MLRFKEPQTLCTTDECDWNLVRIAGRVADRVQRIDASTLLVTKRDLPQGTHDVVFADLIAHAAVTVIANPPRELLERVLVPLLFYGPGAHGSLWTTDVWIRNENRYHVMSPDRVFSQCQPLTNPCYLTGVPYGSTLHWDAQSPMREPNGLQLYVPRGAADGLRFTALVRDLSRQGDDAGAELPIAKERDFRTDPFSLVRVPVAANSRTALRVYGTYGGTVTLRVFGNGETLLAAQGMNLRGGSKPSEPPSIVIHDLAQHFPQIGKQERIRIEVSGSEPLWAFASVTNNTTQHVTMIRPQ